MTHNAEYAALKDQHLIEAIIDALPVKKDCAAWPALMAMAHRVVIRITGEGYRIVPPGTQIDGRVNEEVVP